MANITMGDDEYIGLGASNGRLVFDNTPTPDALHFQDCNLGLGVSNPKGLFQLASSYIVAPAPTGTAATDRQNIIDAISAVGGYAGYAGTVYLQGGTYVISQTISLDFIGGVNIIGAGKDVTIIKMDSGTGQPVFEIKRDNFVTIKNLSIISEQTDKSHTGLVITSSACFSNVENVAISGMNIGLYIIRESFYNNFRNILVSVCNTGILIGDDGGDGYSGDGNGNNFYGGYIQDNSDYGIRIYKGHGNLFSGLTVEGNGQYAGISLDGTGGNSVIGCFIERNDGYQVYINSQSNRIISNHFFKEAGDGDFVYFNSYAGATDGNVIFGNWLNGDGAERREVVLSNLGVGTPNPADTFDVKGNLRVTATGDTYPTAQILNYDHDNVSLNFDSYYTGSGVSGWKSSDYGSNFRIYKIGDKLRISYASGYSAGTTIGMWGSENANVAMAFDNSGRTGVGTVSPNSKLQVNGGDIELGDLAKGVIYNVTNSAVGALNNTDGRKRLRIIRKTSAPTSRSIRFGTTYFWLDLEDA
jgi:hypothetical protein